MVAQAPIGVPEVVIGGLLLLAGVVSAVRSMGHAVPGDPPRIRVLIAVHDAARAGFWLGLAGVFLAYGLLEEPQGAQWLLLIPLALAAVRLFAAQSLSRRMPPD